MWRGSGRWGRSNFGSAPVAGVGRGRREEARQYAPQWPLRHQIHLTGGGRVSRPDRAFLKNPSKPNTNQHIPIVSTGFWFHLYSFPEMTMTCAGFGIITPPPSSTFLKFQQHMLLNLKEKKKTCPLFLLLCCSEVSLPDDTFLIRSGQKKCLYCIKYLCQS